MAKQGVNILVHYHRAEPAEVRETLQEIKSQGVDAFRSRGGHQPSRGRRPALCGALDERYRRLDIVVNSASVFQRGDLLDVSLEDWDLTMAVNLRAPFLITQRAARIMARNPIPGGVIVNICDQGADGPWKARPHHGISKAALWMLTQVSALSLGPGIRVNAIVPGPVMKPAGRETSDEDWAKKGQRSALHRTGSAEDVARAVVFLCREDYITGELLHVNAGEHLP